MARYSVKTLFSFYLPTFFEDELQKFKNKEGAYAISYKYDGTKPAAVVSQESDYLLDNIPVTRIPLVDVLDKKKTDTPTYENVIPHKTDKEEHPLTGKAPWGYQGIPADFLVELNLTRDSFRRKSKVKNVRLGFGVSSANYAIVENGVIVSYSPALQRQINQFIYKNKLPKDYIIKSEDLFGSSEDKYGVNCYIISNGPNSKTQSKNYTRGADLRAHNIGQLSELFIGHRVGHTDGILVFSSNDTKLSRSVVGLQAINTPLVPASKDGTLTEVGVTGGVFITSRTSFIELEESQEPIRNEETKNTDDGKNKISVNTTIIAVPKKKKREGFNIVGTSTTAEEVVVVFPDGEVVRVVPEGYGGNKYWKVNHPSRRETITDQELDLVVAYDSLVYNKNDVSLKPTTKLVNLNLGITRLAPLNSEFLSPSQSNSLSTIFKSTNSWVFSQYFVNKNIEFQSDGQYKTTRDGSYASTETNPDYPVTRYALGMYTGRDPNTETDNLFLSYPDAVIQEVSLVAVAGATIEERDGSIFHTELAILPPVSFGRTAFNKQSLPGIRVSWIRDLGRKHILRYKTKWTKSVGVQEKRCSIRWKSNEVIIPKEVRTRMTWEKSQYNVNQLDYTFRFARREPNLLERSLFFKFDWSRSSTRNRELNYRIRYDTEMGGTKQQDFKLKWVADQIDPVIVRPFYVELGADKVPSISFQVYSDPRFTETLVREDKLKFYFTNPNQFEIVRFDRNAMPYKDIFISILDDPVLDSEDIPNTHVFLGNYTIKGINKINSISLDVLADNQQLNESKSYWVPLNLEDYKDQFRDMKDGISKALPLNSDMFRNDHHRDIVDLDLVIVSEEQCCFTQTNSGTRCSPY